MRVVHVSPTDIAGGADKGAYNLHGALRKSGVDSLMLVQRKYSDDPSIIAANGAYDVFYDRVRDRLDRLPLKLLGWTRQSWWTAGWLPFDLRPALARLKPDVIQFHWAGRGAAPIELLTRLDRYPIVWTLRDMWPLTGGCHYSAGCEKFLVQCSRCPQLGSRAPFDLARWQWRRKYRSRRNVRINYIALSSWMADYARRSPLTFNNEVSVIPNGVDTTLFAPADKARARAAWGLPAGKRIVMFGAINATSDRRKGFSYLRDAIGRLAASGGLDGTMLVVFGSRDAELDVGVEVRSVGWIGDSAKLAQLYACADVMVVPSIEENLGKTAIEAMACGVPVVAFANTGTTDIVDHRTNGYLAKNLSACDLAEGIAWCLERTAEDDRLSIAARRKVMRCFDLRHIASRHIALYHQLLQERHSRVEASAPGLAAYRLLGDRLGAEESTAIVQEGLGHGPVGAP